MRLGQIGPGGVEIDLVAVGDRVDHLGVEVRVDHRPRHQRPLGDRERRIGHDEIGVDLTLGAEPGAARAGAVRGVEREDARRQLRQRDAVLGAGESLGVGHGRAIDDGHLDQPLGEPQRGLDGVVQARAQPLLHDQPVDHHRDRVAHLLVEVDLLLEQHLLAVDLDPRVAVGPQLLEQVAIFALARPHDRRVDGEARPLGQREHLVDDLLGRLAGDLTAALGAVRMPDARVQQAQVVVGLGDRAHGRARVPGRGLLVDRDGRRQALDGVDVGLVHLAEELARVGRERLDIPALPLGIERVEGKARLARPRQAGDHHQLVARERDRDVLEVVLARAPDDNVLVRHRTP